MFKVSKDAVSDLRQIGRDTQQRWGAAQRRRYLDSLNRQFHFLAENPLACHIRSGLKPPARIHHHTRHLIVYEQDGNGIVILRVLHDSMDVNARLDEPG